MGEGKSPDSNLRTLDGRQREKKKSWVGNEMKFELGWELEPLLGSGGRCASVRSAHWDFPVLRGLQ
jgi:hypothetical protein